MLINPYRFAAGVAIADNFNRADNASSLGSSSEGWSWTTVGGTCGISSNQAYSNGSGSDDTARAEYDLGSTDHYAQATIGFTGGSTAVDGVCVRYDASAETYYRFFAHLNGGNYIIAKIVAGSGTALKTISRAPVSGDVIKLTVSGSTLEAFVNGTSVGSVTDSSLTTGTRAGIVFSNSGTVTIDDFSAGTL